MTKRYERARTDFEYLETFAECDDQVSVHDELHDLLRNPTKAKAAKMYEDLISLWMGENFEKHSDDNAILEIAHHHGFSSPA